MDCGFRHWPSILTIALTVFFSGCFLSDDEDDPNVHEGVVAIGFEEFRFSPCDNDEHWWIAGEDVIAELDTRYRGLGVPERTEVYAELRGTTTEKGEWGHVGAYDREFTVSEIVALRLRKPGECPSS